MRNALLLLFLFFANNILCAAKTIIPTQTGTQTVICDHASEHPPKPSIAEGPVARNTLSKAPVSSVTASSPEPMQKLTWVKIKKHLKRYWRRYAIAAVLAGLMLEHMQNKQAARRTPTKTRCSGEISMLERFAHYQFNLLKRAYTWLQTFSFRKKVVTLARFLRKRQRTIKVVTLARFLRKRQRTINELRPSHQEQATVTTPNFVRQAHISLYNELGLRLQRVYKEDVFSLPHGLKISLYNRWSGKREGTYTVGSRIDGEVAGKPVCLRFIQEDSGGGPFRDHLSTECLYFDVLGRRYQRENSLDGTSYHFKLSKTDAQEG